ncbi:hypothetical protein ACJJTC_001658 [Scirpophaga incertulas]
MYVVVTAVLCCAQVVLALEGGYDLAAVCDCAAECVRALLGEPLGAPPLAELARPPHAQAQRDLRRALAAQVYSACLSVPLLVCRPSHTSTHSEVACRRRRTGRACGGRPRWSPESPPAEEPMEMEEAK